MENRNVEKREIGSFLITWDEKWYSFFLLFFGNWYAFLCEWSSFNIKSKFSEPDVNSLHRRSYTIVSESINERIEIVSSNSDLLLIIMFGSFFLVDRVHIEVKLYLITVNHLILIRVIHSLWIFSSWIQLYIFRLFIIQRKKCVNELGRRERLTFITKWLMTNRITYIYI